MAGSASVISYTNGEHENHAGELQISPMIEEWKVEYARFINNLPSTFKSTHPSLNPVPKNRHRGTWISAATVASLQLIYEKTPSGKDDAILVLRLRSEALEVHYVSKMHFSWPHMSCLSGIPARGSRTVFLSYNDTVGQMQKFALRFSAIDEIEKFINVVKVLTYHDLKSKERLHFENGIIPIQEIFENGSPPLLKCPEFNSERPSQAEAISSHITIFRNDKEREYTQSVEAQLVLPNCAPVATQDSETDEHVKAEPVFPPSFTQLISTCCPAVDRLPAPTMSLDASLVEYTSAATKADSGDLKTQFVKYLEGTPFEELLATVENVINQLEEDMVM